jgi:glucose/arabinose dehydrogenase/regulation of enolase protein 1 (concanavalin A-like superfamily)
MKTVLICFSALLCSFNFLFAQVYPANFSQVEVASGISNPTVMAFAPDGRIFVAQQNGVLHVIKNGVKLATPAIQLPVNSSGERGLIGIALHPSFSTNGIIYLYYTLPDGSHNRVSRFWLNGDVLNAGSEQIIIELDPLSSATNHNGGAMHFKGDKLYIAIGDNANSANAQDLATYHGKILRLNANGSIPGDNPFYNMANLKSRRIWALGLRNPYTFDVQPGTGRVFINDVGQVSWEEIDDGTAGGKNFGWPATEGYTTNPAYASPVYAYGHGSGDGVGCAITGGVFFNPSATSYPASYNGKYFFQDLCNGWINYLDLSGGVVRNAFATGLPGQSLSLDVGTDGNLYFLSRSAGRLYKIVYNSTQAPVITDQPDAVTVQQGGTATFTVAASGALPLNFQWRRNGVNISAPNSPTLTLTNVQTSQAGNYSVVVSNSFGAATSSSAALTVTGGQPPVAVITMPDAAANPMYRGGDVILFSGDGSDSEDGPLPESSMTWYMSFHHDNHVHDGPPILTGNDNGSYTIPNSGETSANVFYRLRLVVKDSDGLEGSDFVDIQPYTSTISLQTNPAGLSLTLDGQPVATPYSTLSVEGIRRTLGVVSPQIKNGITYNFTSWSHGGSATQTISTPVNNTTYTANFSQAAGSWISADIGAVGIAGSSAESNGTYTINASGKDIWDTNDQFHFLYRAIDGDTDIRVRVASLANTTHGWTKAGIMIRETLQTTSKNAMAMVTRSNGTGFQRRTTTQGLTTTTASTGAVPVWLRLVRAGNTFTAYRSADGAAWTQIGTQTFSMNSSAYVGMAFTSHNNAALATATFTNVSVTGGVSAASLAEQSTSNSAISIFPNPATGDVLKVQLPAQLNVKNIQVFNTLGQLITQRGAHDMDEENQTYNLDISRMSKGFYFLRIDTDKEQVKAVFVRE